MQAYAQCTLSRIYLHFFVCGICLNGNSYFQFHFTIFAAAVSGSGAWLTTVSTGGTQSDRHAALQVRVQTSPVHTLDLLEKTVDQLSDKTRRDALVTIGNALVS
jgi:hypothetical protein